MIPLFIVPLTLSETSGTFVGLEAQTLLRTALAPAPVLVILSGAAFLVLGIVKGHRVLAELAVYLFASLVTLALAWPTTSTLSPADVRAQAASGEAIETAADVLPGRGSISVPRLEVDLLEAISSMWVDVGRAINVEGDRPFSEVAPISWLLQQGLSGTSTEMIRNWTSACIMPARKALLDAGGATVSEELLPFPGSALHAEMTGMTRQIGAGQVECGAFASTILTTVTAEVDALLSPAGNSMATIWTSEIGLSADEVAQFLIMREVVRAGGPDIQPTSLVGLYGAVRSARAIGGGLKDMLINAANLRFGDALGSTASVLTGGATEAVSDLISGIESLAGKALFVTKFSSDIVGVLQATILAVFPLVVLVALVPGKHIIVIVSYVYLLLAIYSMPLAWSLIDLLADIALSQASVSGLVTDTVVTLEAYASGLIIVTVGTWVALFALAFAILLPIAGGAIGVIRSVRGI